MTRRAGLILVLLAMLPQLVLGMGSGRALELCLCDMLDLQAVERLWHGCSHDHDHEHHDRACASSNDEETPLPGFAEDSSSGHACDHLIVTGHVGRFEPVQTWDYFAVLDALACICVAVIDDGHAHGACSCPLDAKPPGDTLFASRTTSFQI